MEEFVEFARASAMPPDNFAAPQDGRTILVGLIGRGIQFSRTPAMHEEGARALAIPYVYRLLDADLMGYPQPGLPEILRFADLFGFTGLNVTFPFKQQIIPLLDELSPAAREVGAINTVVFRNGRRYGDNTDVSGFRESFLRGMGNVPKNKVLLVGAGGAGTAVAHALLDSGIDRLLVFDTDAEKSKDLVERLAARFGRNRTRVVANLARDTAEVDGIVNATPVGMAKLPGTPLPLDLIVARHWIADIIYVPLETELLRHARQIGCRTLSGEGMAIYQAVNAFQLFTGVKPDIDRMKAAFAAFNRAAPDAETYRKEDIQGGLS